MSYWDTATLVKLYAQEPDSPAYENYTLNFPSSPVTARIALYEARATFFRKEAEGTVQSGTAQTLYSELRRTLRLGKCVSSNSARTWNASMVKC